MTLEQFFSEHPEAAIAFSGGVDSAYLLYAAKRFAVRAKAYYVKSAFQPQFELEDAQRLAKELGAEMQVINVDILSRGEVAANPADRCYHCKRALFEQILRAAKIDGFSVLLDGTNASDNAGDRPGMRALRELSVRSPLRECGLTKAEIRRLSQEAGLFTWDKPAYACLATRIPAGERITLQKLEQTEKAERYLSALGLRNFRVRMLGSSAKLEVTSSDLPFVLKHREEIIAELKKDYSGVLLNLEVRK
ncbi:MAG: ATP-dependent sacrificial sulfur transferase LarE [Faecousia sp.]